MKGLMKYLSPFAPDMSGAVSVLFGLRGILVIIDAGGCTGNVCGFDEPRWFEERSAIFSAGLRDLDAILGRDEKMLEKTADLLEQMDAAFVAYIGTPVPAVIGTDFPALKRMAEKRFGMPVLAIDCNGMDLYDRGAEKAYLALTEAWILPEIRRDLEHGDSGGTNFGKDGGHTMKIQGCRDHGSTDADGRHPVRPSDTAVAECMADAEPESSEILVFGATPLDLFPGDRPEDLRRRIGGGNVHLVGEYRDRNRNRKPVRECLVLAPSGLAAAKKLYEETGIPYRVEYPLPENWEPPAVQAGSSVLILHQSILAEEIRKKILEKTPDARVETATFFGQLRGRKDAPACTVLKEEHDFIELVQNGNFDWILADPLLERACLNFSGTFCPLPHVAISGNGGSL